MYERRQTRLGAEKTHKPIEGREGEQRIKTGGPQRANEGAVIEEASTEFTRVNNQSLLMKNFSSFDLL